MNTAKPQIQETRQKDKARMAVNIQSKTMN